MDQKRIFTTVVSLFFGISLNARNLMPGNSRKSDPKREVQSEKSEQKPFSRKLEIKGKRSIDSNIPGYAQREAGSEASTSPILNSKYGATSYLVGLNRGDVIEAVITDDIIGYNKSLSPVTALITEGKFKNGILVGNATLDPNTKAVLVGFDSIRPPKSTKNFRIMGQAQDLSGKLGIEGEYNSQFWNYYWGVFFSRMASGFASASMDRNKNIYGTYEVKPNLGNAVKNAQAEAATSSAEMLEDRAKSAPEYTKVTGPTFVKVTIVTEPKREVF